MRNNVNTRIYAQDVDNLKVIKELICQKKPELCNLKLSQGYLIHACIEFVLDNKELIK